MAMGIYDGGKKESSVILYEIIFLYVGESNNENSIKEGK